MTTPILPGFYPDPSVCRRGNEYYIANSTFQYLPGIPIHTSTELDVWEHIGNAYDRAEQLSLGGVPSNAGLYAPTIRHHNDRFYLVTSDLLTARDGHLIISARDPKGPWNNPVRTTGAIGIDPDLFWDDDGTCHLSWKGTSVTGLSGILSAPVDPDTGQLTAEVRALWQGTGNQASPEGPHVYRRNGYYYCLLAEGGTERTHSVAIARARDLDGPWEPCPHNPILTHRGTESAVQNVGHADLLETDTGEWIAVYLGVRPRGFTPKFHVNGRETFLADVDWAGDWPIIGEPRPTTPHETDFSDTFTAAELHPRWISHGGIHRHTVHRRPESGVMIRPHPDRSSPLPALGVRARDEHWTAEASLTGSAALQVHMDTRNWAEIALDDTHVTVRLSVVGLDTELVAVEMPAKVSSLVVEAVPWPPSQHLNAGPDQLAFSVRSDVGVHEIARIDGRLLSTEVTAGFTGRIIGIRALNEHAILTQFAYRRGAIASDLH